MSNTIDSSATRSTRARYNRIAPIYDLMESMTESRFRPWRKQLWAAVPAGLVLEVGVGTGKNLPFHPRAARMFGIDLSDRMLDRARARARQLGQSIELREMDAQRLGFPTYSFDAAAATFVFCSVPDPVQGLRELGRVVKPDGHILLLEHVRIDGSAIGRVMDLLNPVVIRLWGANINRRTVENVRAAGLQIDGVESLGPMGMVKLIHARPAN
ncbi:MAG: class I SAM-dependent methyltransferase [Chloroflexi bacterium]|nr:class I SAM-dependent methyltransferase [Chloroflexota bacterium]